MSTQPGSIPSAAPTPAPTKPSAPPVTLHPTSHLDPGAYVRGTHAIIISADVLVHPRAHLVSVHGPLIIGQGAIIGEKAVLGGPVPPLSSSTLGSVSAAVSGDGEDAEDPVKTLIGPHTVIHPHAQIHAGAEVGEACLIEAHAIIMKGVKLGDHVKVCAGCVVDRDVGLWEVVMGDGRRRRVRGQMSGATEEGVGEEGGVGVALSTEKARLHAVQLERESTMVILKQAARVAAASKKR